MAPRLGTHSVRLLRGGLTAYETSLPNGMPFYCAIERTKQSATSIATILSSMRDGAQYRQPLE